MAWDSALESHDPERIDYHAVLRAREGKEEKVSSNPDLNYLAAKSGLQPPFLRRCRRIFGEAVVLESLRRFVPGWSEPIFFGICRNVERNDV